MLTAVTEMRHRDNINTCVYTLCHFVQQMYADAVDSHRSTSSFMLFSTSSSVSLYAIQRSARSANPRTSSRCDSIHPENIVGITIEFTSLCSVWMPRSTVLSWSVVLTNRPTQSTPEHAGQGRQQHRNRCLR